ARQLVPAGVAPAVVELAPAPLAHGWLDPSQICTALITEEGAGFSTGDTGGGKDSAERSIKKVNGLTPPGGAPLFRHRASIAQNLGAPGDAPPGRKELAAECVHG